MRIPEHRLLKPGYIITLLAASLLGTAFVLPPLGWMPNSHAGDAGCPEHPVAAPVEDPLFEEQSALKNIRAPEAWAEGRGDGIRVGMVDSGIDGSHPDLVEQVAAQKDFSDGDSVAEDLTGHGTAVAGILAAKADNGLGIAGVCPECDLLVAKVDAYSNPDADQTARAMRWAADNGASIINVSLGTPAPSEALEKAVMYAADKGVVIVAATGNTESGATLYPAAYPGVIPVSAANRNSHSAPSNSGEISAPGEEVLSTFPGGAYQPLSGTSAATPQVAGAASLLASQGLEADEIRTRLISSARTGPDGDRMLNTAAALEAGEDSCSRPVESMSRVPRR